MHLIGILGGIGLVVTYVGAAWDGKLDEDNWFNGSILTVMLLLALILILGILFFPRTMGLILTPSVFMTPIAFIVGSIRNGIGHGLTMLFFGILMWGVTLIIARVRPQAT